MGPNWASLLNNVRPYQGQISYGTFDTTPGAISLARLSGDRPWKTKWTQWGPDADIGWIPDENYRRRFEANMHSGIRTGRTAKYGNISDRGLWFTGQGQSATWRQSGDPKRAHGRMQMAEVLDWDAYDRDPQYSLYLKDKGIKQFTKLSQIDEAEKWFHGAGERREKAALEELQAKYERERLRREEAERTRQEMQPKYIDVGGSQVPVGGVNDYIQGLHQQWNQTTSAQLDAATQRWQADQEKQAREHAQAQAQAQEAWTQRFNERELDWSRKFDEQDLAHIQGLHDLQYRQQNELADLRAGFAERSAAQDRLYDTRISDLTTQWGTQQSQFERSIGNLEGQVANYQAAQKSALEAQMQDAQRARVASAYAGSAGWDAPQGVHTGKALIPEGPRPLSGGTTAQFGRSGLRISSLNI